MHVMDNLTQRESGWLRVRTRASTCPHANPTVHHYIVFSDDMFANNGSYRYPRRSFAGIWFVMVRDRELFEPGAASNYALFHTEKPRTKDRNDSISSSLSHG
jgi:hypothetical protein